MFRSTIAFVLLATAATAQATVPVEDAPYAAAGDLASRLDAAKLIDSDIYEPVPPALLSLPLLSEARVIDLNGNRIGEVSGVVEQGDLVVAIVLTVGGAFGVSDHPVAVPIHAVLVGQTADQADTRIVVGLTEAELAALPPYEG